MSSLISRSRPANPQPPRGNHGPADHQRQFPGRGHTGHGELSLYIVGKPEDPPAPGPIPQAIHRARQEHHRTITGSQDWTSYALTAPVPASAEAVEFDLTLTGPGQIELRNVTLTRAS